MTLTLRDFAVSDLDVWPGNPRKTIDPAKLNELADLAAAVELAELDPIVLEDPRIERPARVHESDRPRVQAEEARLDRLFDCSTRV